jgi:hypothetical protein
MPSKKGRRTISIAKPAHVCFQAACKARGLSMSGVVESWVAELDKNGTAFAARTPTKATYGTRHAAASKAWRTLAPAVEVEVIAKPQRRYDLELSYGLQDMIEDRIERMHELEGSKVTAEDLLDSSINQILNTIGAP